MALQPYIREQHTLNERLVAIEIVRQILLLRFSLHVRDLVVRALNDTERPIASLVRETLRSEAGLRNAAQVRKLDALIEQINAVRAPAWDVAVRAAEEQLTTAGDAEVEEQRDLFGFLLPGVELLVPMAAGAAALAAVFTGRTLRQWLTDARTAEVLRFRTAVYAGVGAGESPAAVARRLLGTAKLMGRDGATQVSRNNIDTIIRSGAVHFTAHARDQFYRANSEARYTPSLLPGLPVLPVRPVGGVEDAAVWEARRQVRQALAAAAGGGVRLFLREQFVAVLDSRTTKLCRRLDGRRYPVGEGPIPPLHPNCRSDRIVVLPKSLGGPAFDPGSYTAWLRRQPSQVREALLGSRRSNKLNEGDLADALFRDYGARPMTLDEARKEGRRLMAAY